MSPLRLQTKLLRVSLKPVCLVARLPVNDECSVHVLHGVFLARLSDSLLSLKKCLAVLIELECANHAVRWVDWDLMLLTITLLSDDFLNVDTPSSTVDCLNFTFSSFVSSTHDLDLITLSHGDGSNIVLLFKICRQVTAHKLSSNAGRSGEVCLSGLSTLARYAYIDTKFNTL